VSESKDDSTRADYRFGIEKELAIAGFDDAVAIGRGGFGVVYRCVETALGRPVAIKVLAQDIHGDERDRFVREQRALGALSGHPHVVQILQAEITASGRPYIVMPFHSRGSLEDVVRASGPLPWPEVAVIGVKIAGALTAAHEAGIVHRDVKPANILVTDYGEPQLGDFGIARVSGAFETRSSRFAGTPAFTPPEVLKGHPATASSDIYGLGATLFCLLTGHAAFERRSGETVVAQFIRIVNDPLPDLRQLDIPEPLARAVQEAMTADPAARPRSAAAFAETLERVRSGSRRRRATDLPHSTIPVPPGASTRFRPPTPPRPLVDRPRLLSILRNGVPRRLTVIHAPAGFGKSTIAAQWGRVLEADGADVAWLAVEAEDDNAAWFVTHLVHAARRVRPDLAPEVESILQEPSTTAVRRAITLLIDQIHDSGKTLALIVDDWNRVGSRETIDAMSYLLEYGCHHLRMIVTSRNRMGLPLSMMRVRDELVEIDADDLRFDVTEAQSFLVDVKGLPLNAITVSQLQQSTEGWAAALQLASLTLRRRGDTIDIIEHLAGSEDSLNEYLAENVLDTLADPIAEFLLTTSVTDKLCGSLAAALSGISHGRQMLEQIVEMDLFLQHLDEDREWFRYHPLFATFLRQSLQRRYPERVPQLHATAAKWFAEHDMLGEAVDHMLAADNPEQAVDLLVEHGSALFESSRTSTFLTLMAKLPPELATASPGLQLHAAWANLGLQQPQQTKNALTHLETLLRSAPEDAKTTKLQVHAAMIRAAATFVTDQFEGLPAVVTDHLADFADDPFTANAAAVLAAIDAYYRFDFDTARSLRDWAKPYRARGRGPFSGMYGYCMAGLAAYEQLDIAGAEADFRAALEVVRAGGPHSHMSRLAGSLLGALLYHKGRVAEADELLARGLEMGTEGGSVEFLLAIYGTGARAKARGGDLAAAAARLAEGAKVARYMAFPRLSARMVNERVRLGLAISPADRAALAQLPRYHPHKNGITASMAEMQQDSAIRQLAAADGGPEREQALDRAECLLRAIETQPRPRALVQARLLRASCLDAVGQSAAAAADFAPALAQCAEHELIGFVLDTPAAARLVRAVAADSALSGQVPDQFLRQLLTALE
jgi:serine/threonine-protein kinase PknK